MHEATTGIDALLAKSRVDVLRFTPRQTRQASLRGALVVDTRTDAQRRLQGELPDALVIDRTVLEWRLDPVSSARIPEAIDYDVEIVVVCREGFSSSLAAASLRSIGLWRATDMVGGMEAWIAEGFPVSDGPPDVRH